MRGVLRGVLVAPVCLALTAVPASTIEAQAPEQRLTTPSMSYPHEFSAIRGLLELPGGRLLIADGLGQAIVVVDLAAGSADTVDGLGRDRRSTDSQTAYTDCPAIRFSWLIWVMAA